MHFSQFTTSSNTRPKSEKLIRLLSKDGVDAATTAFHRARGHFHGINVDQFRGTLLQETFAFFPEYLVQKQFREWNVSGSGELSCSEFLGGVAMAVKGSRDDHLEMIFRMISEQENCSSVSKAKVACFLKCFDPNSGSEKRTTSARSRSSTADKLLRELFECSQSDQVTFEKFHAVLGSGNSCTVLQYIEWIPTISKRVLKVQKDVQSMLSVPRELTNLKLFETHEGLSTEQRSHFHFELRSILFMISTDPTRLAPRLIIDKFRDIVSDDLFVKVTASVWQSSFPSEEHDQRKDAKVADQVRKELKLFVLGFCCVQAISVQEVYRLLFQLFDENNCGRVDAEQLSIFIQLAKGLSPIDSEREASIAVRRRGQSLSYLSSPPTSPGGSPTINNENPQTITLRQFVEVAQQQPGFSFAEIETALLLFRLTLLKSTAIIPHQLDLSLEHLLDISFSEGASQSNAFCLLNSTEWEQIVERIVQCQSSLSTHYNTQKICEEVTELPSNHVLMPLSMWFLVSFWLGNESEKQVLQQSQTPSSISHWATNIEYQREQRCLQGFWVRVSLYFISCDGFERYASFPQVIAFEHCTIQGIVNAVLYQKKWCGRLHSSVTTTCQCQIFTAERDLAGEIKTVIEQDNPRTLSQDQLTTSLGSLTKSLTLKSTGKHEKLSFELKFSAVEIVAESEIHLPAFETLNEAIPVVKSFQPTVRITSKIPRGLVNLGNTCFMNAVLQCLAATPLLKHHTIRQEIQQDSLSSISPRTNPAQSVELSLPVLLAELLAELNCADTTTSISPRTLFKAFAALSPHLSDGTQQDAEEFLVCLLGHLGNALKRNPKPSEPHILSPRTRMALTSLFRSKDESQSDISRTSLQIGTEDSNGRHDRLVASEWWVSHLVNEPSLINVLFSGQFKSALTCAHCAHQSARFEPFSSLQLPLIACPTTPKLQQELVVIVHFIELQNTSSEEYGPVRTVVQTEEHSTVSDLLRLLPALSTIFSTKQYVIGDLVEHTIQNLLVTDTQEDQLEDKTPASALSSPAHAFQVINIPETIGDTAFSTTGSTPLYLRFVHRQKFLAPFYCTTPIRQRVCGSPFVCFSRHKGLTGLALHLMVFRLFLLGRSSQLRSRSSSTDTSKQKSKHQYAPNFILRLVRDDGLACSRCHWSTGCCGCQILPTTTAAELLDLKNCETIAIDWDLEQNPEDQASFFWLQSYPTRDHQSYTNYCKAHSLMQSFQSLCNTEHLDVNCSKCQQLNPSTLTPHTKQLSLWSLPPILVLQLKRFELVTNNGNYQWKKLSHNVDFPLHGLDLIDLLAPVDNTHSDSEPCSDRCSLDALDPRVRRGIDFLQQKLNIPLSSASRSCTKYDLYAVVNHSGSGISSGHYTAHIRRSDESCWWLADDTSVSPLNEDHLTPSSTAYLLFYVRKDVATGDTELQDMFPPTK